ncbi:hypothetical protein KJ780_00600, partial [Candidatus Micrarchaeota archaeon]|nr:hypothetical protein [Candidatus Micrarchaeota archaeon]
MIEFSLEYALLLILFSALLPGALITLSLFRKSEFSFLEKIMVGLGFGIVLEGALPFLEFILLGIGFSHGLVLFNIGFLWIIGLVLFVYTKAYEDVSELKGLPADILKDPVKYVIPALVVLLFAMNFFIRIQSLSPIFQELDPYFYLDAAQQIITTGYNPLNDQTAWYPLETVSHRTVPFKAYLEATSYSLYTSGGGYNNYLLSLVANVFPPLMAALAIFFVYLGLRAWYSRGFAFGASAILSFVPVFIMKLMAGETEVQPYAFFGLSMFFCFFLWAYRKNDLKFAAFA